jgi:hypothetical protein
MLLVLPLIFANTVPDVTRLPSFFRVLNFRFLSTSAKVLSAKVRPERTKSLLAISEALEVCFLGISEMVVISPLPMSSSRAILMVLSIIIPSLLERVLAIILAPV